MTPADEPREFGPGPETVSFGPGRGGIDPEPPPSDRDDDPRRSDGQVDAWYDEDDPDSEPEHEPSWLADRWHAWQNTDRDRRIVIVLAVVAVVAFLLALVGLFSRDDQSAIELPAVESHGLDPDEAACFAFGLIENRVDVRLGDQGFDAVDTSVIIGPINQEIQAIDDLPGSHPEADYRLITAFAAVADAGTTLTDAEGFGDFRSAVSARSDALAAVQDACNEVAGFDVSTLEPN